MVKFLQGRVGAAALISEVVCTELIRQNGFATLNAVLVHVGEPFAASCRAKPEIPYAVEAGEHFGTIYRDDVEAGPPLSYDDLANPLELLELWVIDTWLRNTDREVYGNILLVASRSGKFKLIAADQSDCLCGAGTFASTGFETAMRNIRRTASTVAFLPQVIFQSGGAEPIRAVISRIETAVKKIDEVLGLVPIPWWIVADIDPACIKRALLGRAQRLEEILNPITWDLPNAGQHFFV